jgi:hypothetical protein
MFLFSSALRVFSTASRFFLVSSMLRFSSASRALTFFFFSDSIRVFSVFSWAFFSSSIRFFSASSLFFAAIIQL